MRVSKRQNFHFWSRSFKVGQVKYVDYNWVTPICKMREWQQFGATVEESSVGPSHNPEWEGSDHRDLYSVMKKRGKRRKWDGFSLLQDRPRHMPGLFWTAPGHSHLWCSPAEAHNCCHGSVRAPGESQTTRAQKPTHVSAKGFCHSFCKKMKHVTLTVYLSFCSLRGAEFLFLLISVTFSLYRSWRSVWAWSRGNSGNVRGYLTCHVQWTLHLNAVLRECHTLGVTTRAHTVQEAGR